MKAKQSASPAAPMLRAMADKIERWAIGRLKPYKHNPRLHSADQIARIKRSFQTFGFIQPIIVAKRTAEIIAGHGRLTAALELGLAFVPVIVIDYLSEAEIRAFRIADNELGNASEWDGEELRHEIEELERLEFDLADLAFDDEDLAAFLAPPQQPAPSAANADALPDPVEVPTSRRGDRWLMGGHRLACIDFLDRPAVIGLLAPAPNCDLVFTDLHVGVVAMETEGAGLRSLFRAYRLCLKLQASVYVCHAPESARGVENAMIAAGLDVRSQIIWARNAPVWGQGRYKLQHVPIFYAGVAGQSDKWYGDKSQTTLWQFPQTGRMPAADKPVELVKRAIENSTRPGDVVLNFHGGHGTSLIACQDIGRRSCSAEFDPKLCDRTIVRWQAYTGLEARLDMDGRTFAEVAAARQAEGIPEQ